MDTNRAQMQCIDQIVRDVAAAHRTAEATIIFCVYTGSTPPANCEPMPRKPAPDVGMLFDSTFPAILARMTARNAAVHDGAIMVGRTQPIEPYHVMGWSFRLFPQFAVSHSQANRCSAFNSCLSMSSVPTVDSVYLISGTGIFCFQGGEVAELPT